MQVVNWQTRRNKIMQIERPAVVLTVFGLFLAGCVSAAPEPTSSAIVEDGPTHERVTSVAVTPDGAAWFGFGDHSTSTPGGGLSRFDGQGWQHFLDDAEVNVLAVAPDGSLWAAVGCGLRRFEDIAWETVAGCGEVLPPGNVLDIAFTPDGAIWVANGYGLARFDGRSWLVHDKLINSLEVAPDGSLWMNGWEGLEDSFYVARFDGENWTMYSTSDSFPGPFMVRAVTPDGLVWGTVPERGLASFDGGSWTDGESWTVHTTADGLPLDNVNVLAVAPDGALWVGTNSGAARFDRESPPDKAWIAYTTENGLASNTVRAIAFGPNGEVWFGTTRIQPAEAEVLHVSTALAYRGAKQQPPSRLLCWQSKSSRPRRLT
jgi:ligand-binding sensor domain-containing protein